MCVSTIVIVWKFTSLDESTGEFLDGLVDLVAGIMGMPPEHQPQPLSQAQTDEFGHVDPTIHVDDG